MAKRRFAEAQEAGKRLGVVYDVLNNHDGQLIAQPRSAAAGHKKDPGMECGYSYCTKAQRLSP
jgi:hypothetical protein